MTANRPSDQAIAQAFWHTLEAQGALIAGTLNLVVERARELDATAAPVVVGEGRIREIASLRFAHAPSLGYAWFHPNGQAFSGKAHATIDDANREKSAALTAALAGD